MRIAVTGASGFIGTEILKQLEETDAEVLALGRGSVDRQAEGSEKVTWVQTDYSEEDLAGKLEGTDVCIHLAAIRGTTGKISDYAENEMITENILLAMKKAHVKRIVFASSIAVYSDTECIPWKEDHPLRPKTLYGITKAACEHLCEYYSRQGDFQYTILRIAQVLGAGERRRGMMNVFMDTAMQGGELKVMGKSVAKRQYIFVDDLAGIFVQAAMAQEEGSYILNAGMEYAYSNLEIAKIVNEVFENRTPIRYDDSFPETCEASCMEIRLLKETLGYVPVDLTTALGKVRDSVKEM